MRDPDIFTDEYTPRELRLFTIFCMVLFVIGYGIMYAMGAGWL